MFKRRIDETLINNLMGSSLWKNRLKTIYQEIIELIKNGDPGEKP